MTKMIRLSLCSLIEMKAIPTNESRLPKTTLQQAIKNHENGVASPFHPANSRARQLWRHPSDACPELISSGRGMASLNPFFQAQSHRQFV